MVNKYISNAPKRAVKGIVINHVKIIFLTKDHLMADNLLLAHAPIIDDNVTWEVLTGTPIEVAVSINNAAVVSAAKPSTG